MSRPKKSPAWQPIPPELRPLLERDTQAHPHWPDYQNRWGLLLLVEGNATGALECFEHALARNPRYGWAALNRVSALALLGRGNEAREALEAAPPAPSAAGERVAELLALMDDASPLPSSVESPGEERLDAVRLRAALQKQRGRPEADRTWEAGSRLVPPGLAPGLVAPWDETGTVTTRAASFNPGSHELFLALSTLQARLGRRDAAQDAASLAFATWSDRGAYLRQRGEIETILGSDREALGFYRDAVRVDPEAPQGHVALAFLYSAAGEPEPARSALIEALHRAPRYADLHYQLALVECARDDLEAALGSLDAALDINPEYRVALLERAHVLCALERWAEARAAVLQVREAGVASSDLAVRLGRIEMALGNEAEAESAWREALEIDPSQPAALRELGRLLRGQGRRDEAKAIWRRLLAAGMDEEPDELDLASGDEA